MPSRAPASRQTSPASAVWAVTWPEPIAPPRAARAGPPPRAAGAALPPRAAEAALPVAARATPAPLPEAAQAVLPTAVAARPAASENTAVFAVHYAHGRMGTP